MAEISKIKMPNNTSYDLKDAIARESIAALPTDVQINGTSIVSNGIANVPLANTNTLGVIKANTNGAYGIALLQNVDDNNNLINTGELALVKASNSQIKAGTEQYRTIVPSTQERATFYGLAKAAGDSTQSSSANAVGNYTNEAKAAIRSMIGAENGDDIIKVQDTQPVTSATKLWMLETAPTGVQVPTVAELEAEYVAKTQYTTDSIAGIIKTAGSFGLSMRSSPNQDTIMVVKASADAIKAGNQNYQPIVPTTQHQAVFYGLATAAGDSTQSASANVVGTYTNEAKDKIQHMLGLDSYFAPYESDTTADQLYNIGDRFVMNGLLYEATDTIALGATILPNTNCENILIGEEFIRKSELKKEINKIYEGIKVVDYTTTEDLTTITINTDLNGLPFKLRNIQLIVNLPPTTTGARSYFLAYYGTSLFTSTTTTKYCNFATLNTVTPADTAWTVFKYEAQCYGSYTSNSATVRASSSTSIGTGSGSGADNSYFQYISADYINSIKLTQYNNTSSLIPSGTRFILYGVPVLE